MEILKRNQVCARYFYQMLMKSGKVSLPSLGSFILEYQASKFAQNKTSLLPPSTAISFSPTYYDDFAFRNLLIESGMHEQDAVTIESVLIDDYNASIAAGLPYDLGGLGTLDNGVFNPNKQEFFDKYFGLSEIKVTPKLSSFKTIKHDEEYVYRLKNNNSSDRSTSFKGLFLPSAIAFLVLGVILFWFFSQNNDKNVQKDSNIVAVETMEDSIFDQNEVNIADSIRIEEQLAKFDSIDQADENELQLSQEEIQDVPDIKQNNELGTPCVIVVGAFKNARNVSLMKKKIADKGFKSYSSSFNGLTRVGVVYNCSQTNPDTFKMKVKKIFSADAWNLHDTI